MAPSVIEIVLVEIEMPVRSTPRVAPPTALRFPVETIPPLVSAKAIVPPARPDLTAAIVILSLPPPVTVAEIP